MKNMKNKQWRVASHTANNAGDQNYIYVYMDDEESFKFVTRCGSPVRYMQSVTLQGSTLKRRLYKECIKHGMSKEVFTELFKKRFKSR